MATTSKKPASKKTKTTRKVSTANKQSGAATTRKTTTKKVTPKKKTNKVSAAKSATSTNVDTTTKGIKPIVLAKGSAAQAMDSLRTLNFFVAFANAVQAGLILWLSKAFGGIHSVMVNFPTNDSLASARAGQPEVVSAAHRLFDVHLSWLIAAFLIVAGVMHLSLATGMRRRYEREIAAHVNRVRWATYALSGSLVLITIALAGGISDLVTLLAVVGFNVIAALVALSREHYTQNGDRTRLVYGIGAVAAAAPWVIILLNVLGTHQYGSGGTALELYWIYLTGLVLVIALGKNLREQTRARGRWIDYVYAEKVYLWLSLVGNGAIAWQMYAAFLKK